jgi:phospholipid/cholesterol/gamma-HCH transport system substrate-binding protein
MATDDAINRKARWLFSAVLAVGAIVGASWYFLSAARYTTYQIETHDAVSGLIVDAPVEFHGVDVGKVTRVELVDPRSIRVLLAIKADAPVSRATVATITARGLATRGFTGYVTVSLEDLATGSGRLVAAPGAKYPVIPTRPTKVVNLDLAIAQVNDNVQALSDVLQSILARRPSSP